MDIGIFIEYDNRVVQIPVNPEQFKVDTMGNNQTTEIIALGEIVVPRKKKLSSISWKSFFPYDSWFSAVRTAGEFQSAEFYLNFLDKIRDDCRPCHLTVTGIGFDSDVVIESFNYYHQAGDHEDTYYDITFKRYQPYAVSIVSKVDIEAELKRAGLVTPPVTLGKPATDSSITLDPSQFTIGAEVFLNGEVFYSSYGTKPSVAFSNRKVKINLINMKGSHPYHVTTLEGGALGWAAKDSLSFSSAPSKNIPPLKTPVTKPKTPLKGNLSKSLHTKY